jgi:Spy/CpxP family protein refolding chaperone
MRASIDGRNVICVATIVACMFAVGSAWAQEGGGGQSGGERHGHRMPSPEERADHLKKALDLNDDQQGKVLSIYQDEQKQMDALRSDTSSSREDRWSKMRQIHENTVSQIKSVLNPDQAKKFDDMEQKMAERRGQRGGNRENAPSQTPQ